jgi:uncharacterized protein YoxC
MIGNSIGSITQKVTVALLLAVLILLAIVGKSWTDSVRAQSELKTTMEAANKTIAAASTRETDRDKQLRKVIADIAELKNKVQTPAQALAALPAALPKLPEPIVFAASSAEQSTSSTLPSSGATTHPVLAGPPPTTVEIPQADLKPLYDAAEDCRACQTELSSAQADLADEKSQLTALTAQRDAALKQAKGGSFWARTRRAAKWLLIGAAAGAVAARAIR